MRTLFFGLVLLLALLAGCLSTDQTRETPANETGDFFVEVENPQAPGLTHGPAWNPPTSENTVDFNDSSLGDIQALRRTFQRAYRDPWYGEMTVNRSTADRIERAIASLERRGNRFVSYGNRTYHVEVGKGAINQTA